MKTISTFIFLGLLTSCTGLGMLAEVAIESDIENKMEKKKRLATADAFLKSPFDLNPGDRIGTCFVDRIGGDGLCYILDGQDNTTAKDNKFLSCEYRAQVADEMIASIKKGKCKRKSNSVTKS